MPDADPRPEEEPVEEVADRIAVHNRDEVTRREALEQELLAEGRSEEGTEVGDEID